MKMDFSVTCIYQSTAYFRSTKVVTSFRRASMKGITMIDKFLSYQRKLVFVMLVAIWLSLVVSTHVAAQLPSFKFGAEEVQYRIVVLGTPVSGATLTFCAGGINVTVPSTEARVDADFVPPESLRWVELDTSPIAAGLLKNVLVSNMFKDGLDKAAVSRTAKLEGFVFRSDGKGQLILGVLTEADSDVLVPRRIAASMSSTSETIRDQEGSIDLSRLNSELMSRAKWPYKSATDAALIEDESGVLMLHGKVELLLGGTALAGSTIAPAESGTITIGRFGPQLNDGPKLTISKLVYSRGMVYVNFGEGTTVRFGKLTRAVELLDGDGRINLVTEGVWRFLKGKWQIQTK